MIEIFFQAEAYFFGFFFSQQKHVSSKSKENWKKPSLFNCFHLSIAKGALLKFPVVSLYPIGPELLVFLLLFHLNFECFASEERKPVPNIFVAKTGLTQQHSYSPLPHIPLHLEHNKMAYKLLIVTLYHVGP